MSQKRIWIGRLHHTRQIENHHKKDQILVYPEGDYIFHFSKFYHLQLALIFRQKVSKKVLFWDPLKNSPPRDFAKLWDLAKSDRIGHASFTSQTGNITRAKAPR